VFVKTRYTNRRYLYIYLYLSYLYKLAPEESIFHIPVVQVRYCVYGLILLARVNKLSCGRVYKVIILACHSAPMIYNTRDYLRQTSAIKDDTLE